MWLSKQLTLDILAITFEGLSSVFERTQNDKGSDPWGGELNPQNTTQNTPETVSNATNTTPGVNTAPQPENAPNTPETTAPAVTLEEVRKTLITLAKDPQHGPNTVRAILKTVNAPKLTSVPPHRLGEVLELAKKELTQ